MDDMIKSPQHYKIYGLDIESRKTLDVMVKNIPSPLSCWVWNAGKYLIRAEKKNGVEDYKKAIEYLEWAIKEDENFEYMGDFVADFETEIGIWWVNIMAGITHNMDNRQAILIDSTFRNIIEAEYDKAIYCIKEIIKNKSKN